MSPFEEALSQAAQRSILKVVMEGSWIQPDYANRFKIPPDLMQDIYSLVDREAEPDFRSIAVPVRRYDGAVIAAINVGAHVDRISLDEMIARFLPSLKAAARTFQPLLL